MKRLCALGPWILVCLLGVGAARGAQEARIAGRRVNLRAKPSLTAEVVGQLDEGAHVTVKSLDGEWAEIVPPENLDFWVHRDFLRDGVVQTRKLNVRAGPGINFSVVGVLEKGERVPVRGAFGEWIKVRPSADFSLWVSREFVETSQPQKPKRRMIRRFPQPAVTPPSISTPAAAPPPAVNQPEPPPAKPASAAPQAVPAARQALPSDWNLVPLEGQGKQVEREGFLKHVGFLMGAPTRFRLIRYENGKLTTLCYIYGNEAQLEDWRDERMLIHGRLYWLIDTSYPVLVVDQLVPRPSAGSAGR